MDLSINLKELASIYIHPVTIVLELLFLGVILIAISRRKGKKPPGPKMKKAKKWAGDLGVASIITAAMFLYLCSIKPVADPLIFMLEKKYPPLRLDYSNEMEELNPEFIVVLGGGERYDENRPATSRLNSATLTRTNAAVQLARIFEDTKLIFTGTPNETKGMTEVVELLGIDPDRLSSEDESQNTKDHPVKLKPILGDAEFLLVTSGVHMPRAMALFRGQGLEPTAAACDLHVWPRFGEENPYQPRNFIPEVESLVKTHNAFHEYLGLAWAGMRNQTAPAATPPAGAAETEVEDEEADPAESEKPKDGQKKDRGAEATIEL